MSLSVIQRLLTEDISMLFAIEKQTVGPYEIEIPSDLSEALVLAVHELGAHGGGVHGASDDVMIASNALDRLDEDVLVALLPEPVKYVAASLIEELCEGIGRSQSSRGALGRPPRQRAEESFLWGGLLELRYESVAGRRRFAVPMGAGGRREGVVGGCRRVRARGMME
ncbi:hypothetical protein BWQ96_04700 [Gracilariopsis chorda]|uniref:Uncharacterized protein n=1 Tax=Gracilariopsis chorda TaxID=448386 RepID=A0A2V3ITY4_9FLOR|nr:hypothetical protein BWQ96_04700 [Gracilariopsis chorda]|eukprot:PXF45562.1 hypothetical protein BWQ96_04700 [Gracilariopsis chorda]